jgi:ubiquinone/menaquinone biosynthesis C-methylase UbiE
MVGKKVCIFPMGPPYQLIHDCRNRFPLYDKSLRLPSKTNITLVHKIPMKNYKDDSRKTFDKVAIKYESSCFGRQARRLYDKVEQFNHEFILDLGCGKGNLLEKLKKYNSRLYGADISPEMIKYARERLGNYAELNVADSESLPWEDNSFDIIVCTLSFHHYPNPGKSLNEMKRVLRKNGHIIIAEAWLPPLFRDIANLFMNNRLNKTGDVRVYSKYEWLNMLRSAGFNNIDFEKVSGVFVIITAEFSK